MTAAPAAIPNRAFRRALLSLSGLGPPLEADPLPRPTSAASPEWVDGMVKRLGFVQVDAVSAVERAQHQILFARNPRYRQEWLDQRIEQARTLFENWTHDAAILPSELYPYWRHVFERFRQYRVHKSYERYFSGVTEEDVERVFRRIREKGPLKPRDFDPEKARWDWAGVDSDASGFPVPTVAKVAMEYLWRTGKLAVARRDKREKVYDLVERVLPEAHTKRRVSQTEFVDWACREALRRLGAATPAQIASFFYAVSTERAGRWCERALGREIARVEVELADRSRTTAPTYSLVEDLDRIRSAPAPPRRLRLLNPFDPLIHDRQRTARVFDFEYALEIFMPPKKRKYGYYVLPILEGERFTGRIDVKADRKKGVLNVISLHWEPGVRPTARRDAQLERELGRLAKFCGVDCVSFARSYQKS